MSTSNKYYSHSAVKCHAHPPTPSDADTDTPDTLKIHPDLPTNPEKAPNTMEEDPPDPVEEDSDMVKFPEQVPKNPQRWNPDNVINFVKANKDGYYIGSKDIDLIFENGITGRVFPTLTKEELVSYGLTPGGIGTFMALIHDLREPQVVTQSPPQVLAELDSLRKIVEKLRNPSHVFKLIIHPKTKTSITWTVDINSATLGMLGTRICEEYSEYKDSTLLFIFKQSDDQIHKPQTNEELQQLLRSLVAHGEMTVRLTVITPTKPFSDWTLKEVWELYEINNNVKADLLHFPRLECQHIPLNNDAILPLMMDNLERLYRTTPLFLGTPEATRSLYVHSILNIAIDVIFPSNCDFIIRPKQFLKGTYGRGPVDYAIEMQGGVTVGVTEVKRDDFSKGVAQNTVQVETVLLNRKRKADNMNNTPTDDTDNEPITRFGIITDAETWRFLECTRNDDNKPKFRLSDEYKVSYRKQSMSEDVQKITEVIKWLLTEAMKARTTAGDAAGDAAAPDPRKKQKRDGSAAQSC